MYSETEKRSAGTLLKTGWMIFHPTGGEKLQGIYIKRKTDVLDGITQNIYVINGIIIEMAQSLKRYTCILFQNTLCRITSLESIKLIKDIVMSAE